MPPHARTRPRRIPFNLFAATVFQCLLCGSLYAQTGPALLVEPFPKEQLIDARGSWLFEDAGHVQGSNESLRLAFYETAGRVRILPGNLVSPRVGWDLEYIDLRGSTFRPLPSQLTDQSVGVAFPVAQIDDWIFGVALGLGYAGSSPYAEGTGWYGKGTAVAFRQFSEKDAIVFVLDYNANRTFLPDVPVPGFAYTRRVSPQLFYVVGLPVTSVTWKPTEHLSLEAGWIPIEEFHAAAGYEFVPHLSAFASLDYRSDAFKLEGLRGNDRLLFQQRARSSASAGHRAATGAARADGGARLRVGPGVQHRVRRERATKSPTSATSRTSGWGLR